MENGYLSYREALPETGISEKPTSESEALPLPAFQPLYLEASVLLLTWFTLELDIDALLRRTINSGHLSLLLTAARHMGQVSRNDPRPGERPADVGSHSTSVAARTISSCTRCLIPLREPVVVAG